VERPISIYKSLTSYCASL